MKNKLFWFGMLVMVLAFGMMVVGCDNGDNNNDNGNNNNDNGNNNNDNGNNNNDNGDGGNGGSIINPFVGTWLNSDNGLTFIFYTDGMLKLNAPALIQNGITVLPPQVENGTYTYSGNSATINFGYAQTVSITIIGDRFVYQGLIFIKQ